MLEEQCAGTVTAGQDLVITDFGARPDSEEDTVPTVLAALARCRDRKGRRIVFPRGEYHFYRDRAPEHNLCTSNNDGGVKRIGLPLFEFDDLTLDGEGSRFVFHGRMVPLAIWNCRGIHLRNFSIDWDRPFTLEGEILDQGPDFVDVALSPATPYVIRHRRLAGLDDDCYPQTNLGLIQYDPVRQEFAHDSREPWGPNRAEELAPGRVRLHGGFGPFQSGYPLLMRMELRHSPGISVGRSSDVALTGVSLHAAAGMGLIAQESRDLHLDRFMVIPAPDSGRILSVQDDATHFCNCRGQILMDRCRFENNWDDGTNVHGIYRVVTQRGPDWVVTQSRHYMQLGVGMGEQDDDRFEFLDPQTMQTVHEGAGHDFKVYGPHETAITFREPLPDTVRMGTVLANLSATPDLTIRRCVVRSTRPRGFLIGTPGKVLVEENEFHTPGAAVLIGADCNFWYESGAVRDVLIRRNLFDHCRYKRATCTPAPVSITPAVPAAGVAAPFEKNIRIEENEFRSHEPLLVQARSVAGLTIRNNRILRTSTYPARPQSPTPFVLEDCVNSVIEDNAC